MKKTPPKKKKKLSNLDQLKKFTTNYWIFGFILLPILFSIYLFIYMFLHEERLIPFNFIFLFLGLAYSSYHISPKKNSIIACAIGAYYLSFFTFIPFKNEEFYNLTSHIQTWPYFFLIGYLCLISFAFRKDVMPILSEGMSFLFTLSLLYLLYEKHWWSLSHLYTSPFQILITAYACLSFFHAFSHTLLNPLSRFILSLGTCIIVLSLAISNATYLFNQGDIPDQYHLKDQILLAIQYFLLGTSGIFLFLNIQLIIEFLPSKYSFSYWSDLKDISNEHIQRFSDAQMPLSQAIAMFILSVLLFSINYKMHWIPPLSMIWLVILIVPMLIQYIFPTPITNPIKTLSKPVPKRKRRASKPKTQ